MSLRFMRTVYTLNNVPVRLMCIQASTTRESTARIVRLEFRSVFGVAHLGKEFVDKPVQNTTKDFIPHQNREQKIAQDHGTRELNSIWPVPRGSEADTDNIKRENEGKEFP